MERRAERRLDSISRHLLPTPLRLSPASAVDSGSDGCPVVIGGMVLDIHAKPHSHPRPGTTTPGEVRYIRGGVARNIAECMAKLGVKSFMISVVGNDMAGDELLGHWKNLGLSAEGILKLQDVTTPVVSNIFDANGELAAAVASVGAVEKCLTGEWLRQFQCKIKCAPLLMVDANLHPESLEVVCKMAAESGVPVWFEPVSVTKSKRVLGVHKHITFASPNEDELIAMANSLSNDFSLPSQHKVNRNSERESIDTLVRRLAPGVKVLLDAGIKFVVVTLGSDGVLLCSRQDMNFLTKSNNQVSFNHIDRQLYQLVHTTCYSNGLLPSTRVGAKKSCLYALHYPALPASVVSLTGAGDCLVGGMLASICSGLDIFQSVAVAVSTAKAAVETELNVPSEFSLPKTAVEARQIFAATRMFRLG